MQPIIGNMMFKSIFLVSVILFSNLCLMAQAKKNYNDGPYIEIAGDSIKIKWMEMGQPRDTFVFKSSAGKFKIVNLPEIDLNKLDNMDDYEGD